VGGSSGGGGGGGGGGASVVVLLLQLVIVQCNHVQDFRNNLGAGRVLFATHTESMPNTSVIEFFLRLSALFLGPQIQPKPDAREVL